MIYFILSILYYIIFIKNILLDSYVKEFLHNVKIIFLHNYSLFLSLSLSDKFNKKTLLKFKHYI